MAIVGARAQLDDMKKAARSIGSVSQAPEPEPELPSFSTDEDCLQAIMAKLDGTHLISEIDWNLHCTVTYMCALLHGFNAQ